MPVVDGVSCIGCTGHTLRRYKKCCTLRVFVLNCEVVFEACVCLRGNDGADLDYLQPVGNALLIAAGCCASPWLLV